MIQNKVSLLRNQAVHPAVAQPTGRDKQVRHSLFHKANQLDLAFGRFDYVVFEAAVVILIGNLDEDVRKTVLFDPVDCIHNTAFYCLLIAQDLILPFIKKSKMTTMPCLSHFSMMCLIRLK